MQETCLLEFTLLTDRKKLLNKVEKLKYIVPRIEIVQGLPSELCAGSKTADYGDMGEGGGGGEIPIDPDDAGRFTWGNLWAEEEEEYEYAYSGSW